MKGADLVDEELLKTAEAARMMGITKQTLDQWRYRGIGPRYLKVGSNVRYRPSDVLAWLTARERTATGDRPATAKA